MKLKQDQVVSLCKELGMVTADKWATERLEKKLQTLPKLVKEEELEAKTADGKSLLKKICTAVAKGEEITISSGAAKETKAPAKAEKAPPKPAKKAAKEEVEEDEDEDTEEEEESEDEDAEEEDAEDEDTEEAEEEADEEAEDEAEESEDEDEDTEEEEGDEEEETPKKPSKKGKAPPKSAGKNGGPGVIASILEFLQAASEESPISKKGILKRLVKRFPERAEESMARTINVQIPNRIKNDKGLVVSKNDKGQYWISGKVKKSKD